MDAGASLPFCVNNVPVGVMTLERNEKPFSTSEIKSLRLVCDLNARRLQDLERQSQWFGKRWVYGLHKGVSHFFGIEHTWMKLAALAVPILLTLLFFYPLVLPRRSPVYSTHPYAGTNSRPF